MNRKPKSQIFAVWNSAPAESLSQMLPSNRSPSANLIQRRKSERLKKTAKTLESLFPPCHMRNFSSKAERPTGEGPSFEGRPKSELPRQVRTQHDPNICRRRAVTVHDCRSSSDFAFCHRRKKDMSGRQSKFCEILGPGFCRECTREGSRKDNKEEIHELFWPKGLPDYRSKTPLYDIIIRRETSLVSGEFDLKSRGIFARLHNFNRTPEYFINPSDGMGTTVTSDRPESPGSAGSTDNFENSSIDSLSEEENETTRFFQSLSDTATSLRSMCSLNRSRGNSPSCSYTDSRQGSGFSSRRRSGRGSRSRSEKVKRETAFSRLPVEPPLIAIDFANSIMNPANQQADQLEASLYGTATTQLNPTMCLPDEWAHSPITTYGCT